MTNTANEKSDLLLSMLMKFLSNISVDYSRGDYGRTYMGEILGLLLVKLIYATFYIQNDGLKIVTRKKLKSVVDSAPKTCRGLARRLPLGFVDTVGQLSIARQIGNCIHLNAGGA